MEDKIVAQIEWYLGRINLEGDRYLRAQMDPDFWVHLDVILDFPKMVKLGVRDASYVASLLAERSPFVEVDQTNNTIRPAWVKYSTLVISDVPATASFGDLMALLAGGVYENGTILPNVPGLMSLYPQSKHSWIAVFETSDGAQNALSLVAGHVLNGSTLHAEAYKEHFAVGPAANAPQTPHPSVPHYQQQQSQIYMAASVQQQETPYGYSHPPAPTPAPTPTPAPAPAPANPMITSMWMPVHVMSHDAVHAYYGYPQPLSPTYAPQMETHRQDVDPRQPHAAHHAYPVEYVQAGHNSTPTVVTSSALHIEQNAHLHQQHLSPRVLQATDLQISEVQASKVWGVPPNAATPTSPHPPHSPHSPGAALVNGIANLTTHIPGTPNNNANVKAESMEKESSNVRAIGTDEQKTSPTHPEALYAQQQMAPGNVHGRNASEVLMSRVGGDTVMHRSANYSHYSYQGEMMVHHRAAGSPNEGPVARGPEQAGYRETAPKGSHRAGSRAGRVGGEGSRGAQGGNGSGLPGAGYRGSVNRKSRRGNRNGGGRYGHSHADRAGDVKGYDGREGPNGGNRDGRRNDKRAMEPNLNAMHFPPLPASSDGIARPRNPGRSKSHSPKVRKAVTPTEPQQERSVDMESLTTSEVTDDAVVGANSHSDEKHLSSSCADEESDHKSDGKSEAEDVAAATATQGKKTEARVPAAGARKERQLETEQAKGGKLSYAAILRKDKGRGSTGNAVKRTLSESSSESVVSGTPKSPSGRTSHDGDRQGRRKAGQRHGNGRKEEAGRSRQPSDVQAAGNNGVAKAASGSARPSSEDAAKGKPQKKQSVWANVPKALFQANQSPPTKRPQPCAQVSAKTASPTVSRGEPNGLIC